MKKNFLKTLKKFGIYTLASLLLSIALIYSYLNVPETLTSIDNRIKDYMFILRGEKEKSKDIIIIDLDEKSLKTVGQWPWSRDIFAQLLINLTNKEVKIIGLDIVFAEEDRTSPHKIVKDLNLKTDIELPNYDEILAYTIANTPTVLGYQFQMEEEEYIEKEPPFIKAIIRERNKQNVVTDFIPKGEGSILNIPILQEYSHTSGYFNNLPDPSGVVRSVPLLIEYEEQVYPALALEMVRMINNKSHFTINYRELGVENIIVGKNKIETDRTGKLLINYRGGEGSFEYYSAVDILNDTIPKEKIAGKIALVGTTAAGLLDLRATPFDFIYPGVEVHANAIDNILNNEFLRKNPEADAINFFLIIVLTFLTLMIIAYATSIWMPLLLVSIFSITMYLLYHRFVFNNEIYNILYPMLSIILASITGLVINYFLEKRNELLIKRKFASKVSKEVMESLLENPDNKSFEAMEKEITVFFSDIRSFTSISESMDNPRTLINYLNEYMTPMSNIIIEEKGTIDKYIGDAIMAYWNAPGDVENHPDKALSAAIKQIEYLKPLNKKLKSNNLPLIDIGIGLNTGIATVGEMGSEQRSDYTCIGDPINLGARLESLCKGYGAKIIISEFMKEKLVESYAIMKLDLVRVKGKNEPVEIFEVLGFKTPKLDDSIVDFNKAIDLYRQSQFKNALDILKTLKENKNLLNYKIIEIYIDRCIEYIKTPPENFDGVYTHTTKG